MVQLQYLFVYNSAKPLNTFDVQPSTMFESITEHTTSRKSKQLPQDTQLQCAVVNSSLEYKRILLSIFEQPDDSFVFELEQGNLAFKINKKLLVGIFP